MDQASFHQTENTYSRASTLEKVRRLYDFEVTKKLQILDAGCGDGKIGGELVALGHEVHGMDVARDALAHAAHKGVMPHTADIEKLWPFTDRRFDVVLLLDVIEHVYDPEQLLHEAKRVLKPDGVILLTELNHFGVRNRLRYLTGRSGIVHWNHTEHYQPWRYSHIRFMRLEEALRLINVTGLSATAIQLNFMGDGIVPARLLPKMARRKLLRTWPNLFSGKFVFRLERKRDVAPRYILVDRTPKGL